MARRYDQNPFAEEEEEVNPFSVSQLFGLCDAILFTAIELRAFIFCLLSFVNLVDELWWLTLVFTFPLFCELRCF